MISHDPLFDAWEKAKSISMPESRDGEFAPHIPYIKHDTNVVETVGWHIADAALNDAFVVNNLSEPLT